VVIGVDFIGSSKKSLKGKSWFNRRRGGFWSGGEGVFELEEEGRRRRMKEVGVEELKRRRFEEF